jgi:hypothetical protein
MSSKQFFRYIQDENKFSNFKNYIETREGWDKQNNNLRQEKYETREGWEKQNNNLRQEKYETGEGWDKQNNNLRQEK